MVSGGGPDAPAPLPAPAAGGVLGTGAAGSAPVHVLPRRRRCASRRRFTIRLRQRPAHVRRAKVWVDGKRVHVVRRGGRLRAVVNLQGLRKGRFTVRAIVVTKAGRRLTERRRYRTCVPGPRR